MCSAASTANLLGSPRGKINCWEGECSRGRGHRSQLTTLLLRVLDRRLRVANLDLLVAADPVWHGGKLHRKLVVGRRQVAADLLQEALVPPDQLAFQTPDLAAPEGVEGRAAQPAHRDQQAQQWREPASQLELPLEPVIAQHRRVEVQTDLRLDEGVAQPLRPFTREQQTSDLVLVLVRQQLVEVAEGCFGQVVPTGQDLLLPRMHSEDGVEIPTSVGRVLILNQLTQSDGQHSAQARVQSLGAIEERLVVAAVPVELPQVSCPLPSV